MNKPNAVVLLNPGDRCSHMLDYYKKYNFVPIILRVCQDETKDISNDIDETIAKIKLRIKNLVVLNDKGQMSTAITLLKKYNVLAIVPYEETIIYGDLLAKKLHLNGNDPLTSVIRKNKYELNNLLAKKNVRAIKSRLLKKQDSVATIAKDFKFPLVMKPTYGSSSMNVFIISNMNELKDKFNFFKKTNIKNKKIFGDIIIQEFIEGLEYVANFISYNGKHILTDIWEYEKFKHKNGVNLYRRTNLIVKLSPIHKKIAQYGLDVLNAMKYQYGPTHLEMKLDKNGPVLIEANLRIMGGNVFLHEPLVANKFTTTEFSLLVYMNNSLIKPYFAKALIYCPSSYHITAYTLFSNKEYIVKKIISNAEMKKLFPTFIKWKLYVAPNKKLIKTINYISEPAEIELCDKDNEKINRDCKKLQEIEKNNLEKFFIPKK